MITVSIGVVIVFIVCYSFFARKTFNDETAAIMLVIAVLCFLPALIGCSIDNILDTKLEAIYKLKQRIALVSQEKAVFDDLYNYAKDKPCKSEYCKGVKEKLKDAVREEENLKDNLNYLINDYNKDLAAVQGNYRKIIHWVFLEAAFVDKKVMDRKQLN